MKIKLHNIYYSILHTDVAQLAERQSPKLGHFCVGSNPTVRAFIKFK